VTETILPHNRDHWLELRTRDLTSTETPALFGCSPYITEFELAHRKRQGVVVKIEESERMKWGNRLQDAIAYGIAEDQGWTIRRMEEYMRDPTVRIGASFDYAIGEEGLLEIKNVDALAFRDGWLVHDDGSIEAPPHIEIQVQTQLAVSERKFAYIGALVGGNRVVLIKREPDQGTIDAIRSKANFFWSILAAGKEPEPNFEKDAAFIVSLMQRAEPGKILSAKGDANFATLAQRYRDLGQTEKQIKEEREAVKAKLLLAIGDAEKVLGDDFTVSAGVVGPARVEYDREGYRNFRISWKKKAS
jgi:putative phage-type endonuclease